MVKAEHNKRHKSGMEDLLGAKANVPHAKRRWTDLPLDFLRSSRSRRRDSIWAVNILATGFTSSSRMRSDFACAGRENEEERVSI